MSALSDVDISQAIEASEIFVDPFDLKLIQPASLEIRLGEYFKVDHWKERRANCDMWYPETIVDPLNPVDHDHWSEEKFVAVGDRYVIRPGEFMLGCSLETVGIGATLRANVCGKSSWGRLGLLIHCTAGFIDPGFKGIITLELYNVSRNSIYLYPGMRIAQLAFERLITPAQTVYGSPSLGSRYQNQVKATASRYSA